MEIVKALKYLPEVLKSWLGVFALAIVVMAGLCLGAVTTSAKSVDQTTVRVLIVGCLVIVFFALCVIVFVAVKYQGAFDPQHSIAEEMVCYYLRGVRYHYLRSRNGLAVRINVMQPVVVDGHKMLHITLMDYRDAYHEDERTRYWREGKGKCGEAWQTKEQEYYAADDRSVKAAFVAMDAQYDQALNSLRSVLCTPILWGNECIGVLNFDSDRSGKETGVNDAGVQALFREAAVLVAPALSILARSRPRA
jgi:hypothetical protein